PPLGPGARLLHLPGSLLHLAPRRLSEDDSPRAGGGSDGRRSQPPAHRLPDHPAAERPGADLRVDLLLHALLERVPVRAGLHVFAGAQDRSGRARDGAGARRHLSMGAADGRRAAGEPPGRGAVFLLRRALRGRHVGSAQGLKRSLPRRRSTQRYCVRTWRQTMVGVDTTIPIRPNTAPNVPWPTSSSAGRIETARFITSGSTRYPSTRWTPTYTAPASAKCRGDCARPASNPGTELATAPTYGTKVPRKVRTPRSSHSSIPTSESATAVSVPIRVIETTMPPTHLRSPWLVRRHASSNTASCSRGTITRTPRRYTS